MIYFQQPWHIFFSLDSQKGARIEWMNKHSVRTEQIRHDLPLCLISWDASILTVTCLTIMFVHLFTKYDKCPTNDRSQCSYKNVIDCWQSQEKQKVLIVTTDFIPVKPLHVLQPCNNLLYNEQDLFWLIVTVMNSAKQHHQISSCC